MLVLTCGCLRLNLSCFVLLNTSSTRPHTGEFLVTLQNLFEPNYFLGDAKVHKSQLNNSPIMSTRSNLHDPFLFFPLDIVRADTGYEKQDRIY